MFVKLIASLSIACLLFASCEKEVESETVIYNGDSSWVPYYAYFEGMITDSITGAPITGYTISHEYIRPEPFTDSLETGFYSLATNGFTGHYSVGFPEEVVLDIKDGAGNVVKTVSFNGDLLIMNDTITVDFQVNL